MKGFEKIDYENDENWSDAMERNFERMEKQDAQDADAKKKGQEIGRIIRQRHADGYAYYEIVGETKTRFKVKVVKGIGDDWVLPQWGKNASVSKRYVKDFWEMEDSLEKLFSKKKK